MSKSKIPWIVVEVVDVYPTTLGHCPHFNLVSHEFQAVGAEFCPLSDQVVEYPSHVIGSHVRVAELVKGLKNALSNIPVNVQIRMVDATSAGGILKCIRHRVRGQSAIIVNGKKVCDGNYSLDEAIRKIREEALSIVQRTA